MAVRAFDLTSHTSTRLVAATPAPGRSQRRRSRQRWALVGVVGLAAPFAVALVVLGASH